MGLFKWDVRDALKLNTATNCDIERHLARRGK